MTNSEPRLLKTLATPGSLRGRLRDLFHRQPSSTSAFADELCAFIRDLTNARGVTLFSATGAEPLKLVGIADPIDRLTAVAEAAAATDSVVSDGALALAATLTLPDGTAAILALHMPPGNPAQLSLAFERLELVHQICQFYSVPAGLRLPAGLLETTAAVGEGDWSQAQGLSDSLATTIGGATVSIAELLNGRVKRFVVSGQSEPSRRGGALKQLQERIDTALASAEGARGIYLDGCAVPKFAIVLNESPESDDVIRSVLEVFTGCNRKYRSWAARNRSMLVRAVVGIGLAALALFPVDDAVNLPAWVVAESERVVTAPVDGQIAEIAVEDGDRVTAGESLLFRMDKTQIDLDLAETRAALSAALARKDRLHARSDAAELNAAKIEVEQARLAVDALEEKRRQSDVYAPIDGIVRAEELSKRLGSFVGLGMPVLSVYGEAGVVLQVVIDPRSRGRMHDGIAGEFRPDAAPSRTYPLKLAVISPAPVFEGDIVTYLGRTPKLESADDGFLTSGMQGVAHFIFEEVALGVLVWRRVRDWALITFWI